MENMTDLTNIIGGKASEKYDGIQGQWDGSSLTTRTGNTINAPAWWLSELPNVPLIGELWIGRGQFDTLQSIVTRDIPDNRWNDVRFMVFSGDCAGKYSERVQQITIESREQFDTFYSDIISKGGEGVVLDFDTHGPYKYKPTTDDDGILKSFTYRESGEIKSLVIKNRAGQTLKINIGPSLEIRQNPPRIGDVIRYQFNGYTSKGNPRFARFAGVRAENSLEF
jgi:DNA ligase-1